MDSSVLLRAQSLPAISLALAALLLLEILLISQSFDARILLGSDQLTGLGLGFAYLGDLAKVGVLTLFVFGFFLYPRYGEYLEALQASYSLKRSLLFFVAHLICLIPFFLVTQIIFSSADTQRLSLGIYSAWAASGIALLVCWLLVLAPTSVLTQLLRREWLSLLAALIIGAATWLLATASQDFWDPLADKTFAVTVWLLGAYPDELLYVDASRKTLGLGDFIVSVAPACSGYEGIGLISAFVGIYLFIHRQELRFPRALLLFPIGALVIWLLNSARIALLVMIGYHWSPDVAVGGFHSQAGWITFILTSLGVLWFASRSHWLARNPLQATPSSGKMSQPVATLLPLVILLAFTLLSSALVADFDYLYPIRVIAVAAILIKVWPILQLGPYRPRLEAFIAAVVVAALWVILLGQNMEANQKFVEGFSSMPLGWALVWLAFRFVGSAITVPIAEELAFRGYLLCRFSRHPLLLKGRLPWDIAAILLSSLAFGALHNAWLAGSVAGVIYALVRLRTGHVGDAILAHAGTNGLLCIYAATTGNWSVL